MEDLTKAQKGSPEYEIWLQKYRAKRGISRSAAEVLAEISSLLEAGKSYKGVAPDGKPLSVKEEAETTIVRHGDDVEEFETRGLVTRRLEEKLASIFGKAAFSLIKDDLSALTKAKKGTKEYDEWLRKYREKRGRKADEPSSSSSRSSISDKDRERAESLADLFAQGKTRRISNYLSNTKDETKIQRRFDAIKEAHPEIVEDFKRRFGGYIPSVRQERADNQKAAKEAKDALFLSLSVPFSKFEKDLKKHFSHITDKDKYTSRFGKLKSVVGSDCPALDAIDPSKNKLDLHEPAAKRGWLGDYRLNERNTEAVNKLVSTFVSDLKDESINKKDLEFIRDYDKNSAGTSFVNFLYKQV